MVFLVLYLVGFVPTALINLIAARYARRGLHGFKPLTRRDAQLMALNSFLWFIFWPLVAYGKMR